MSQRVDEVASGVFFVEASHTNFVIVVDGDDLAVIDTGYPRDRRILEGAIEQIGRKPADCSALLLTHGHVDHTGSAEWLRETADLPVFCHADEEHQTRGRIKQQISEVEIVKQIWRPAVFRFTMNAVSHGGLRRRSIAAVTTFSGDDVLDVPGQPRAVFTPGHTDGHTSFHLPDRGVLVAGDALITVDVWGEHPPGPQLIRPQFNHDHQQAVASLSHLESLDADVVLPGHGEPWRGTPAAAITDARARLG